MESFFTPGALDKMNCVNILRIQFVFGAVKINNIGFIPDFLAMDSRPAPDIRHGGQMPIFPLVKRVVDAEFRQDLAIQFQIYGRETDFAADTIAPDLPGPDKVGAGQHAVCLVDLAMDEIFPNPA